MEHLEINWSTRICALLFALAAVVALSACETPATQVLVQLDTDLPETRTVVVRVAAQQIDANGATVGRQTNWTFTRGGPLNERQLPGTFGVTPPSGAPRDSRMQLVVSVFVAANSVAEPAVFFRRTVRFRFTPNRTLGIGVFLSLRCGEPTTGCTGVSPADCTVSTLCEERGLTCGNRAECVAGEVTPTDIDAGFTTDEGPLDATLDAPATDVTGSHACIASDDECAPSEHCDTASRLCVAGCHDNRGCTLASTPLCDTTMHSCVACLNDSHCPPSSHCAGGVCARGCTDASQCSPGQDCCGGTCLDTLTSATACGACGAACSVAHAIPACVGGACTIRNCTAPYLDCNGMVSDGCEANRLVSPDHCGDCNSPCIAGPNATAMCMSGTCMRGCAAGFADCNGDPSDGCEVTLATDAAHCGACGRACTVANGSGTCSAGMCSVASCSAGFGDCNASFGDGCETDTTTDPTNCGGCGMACAREPGVLGVACGGGSCSYTCYPTRADCDGMAANGCEIDTSASLTNCGVCGRVCSLPHANPICYIGQCQISTCATGWGDCDGATTNGCETDLSTSDTNCGACGNTCTPVPNATRSCRSAGCALNCAPQYADCDYAATNGCEIGPLHQFPVASCTNVASATTITSSGSTYGVNTFDHITDAEPCTRGMAFGLSGDFTFTFPSPAIRARPDRDAVDLFGHTGARFHRRLRGLYEHGRYELHAPHDGVDATDAIVVRRLRLEPQSARDSHHDRAQPRCRHGIQERGHLVLPLKGAVTSLHAS